MSGGPGFVAIVGAGQMGTMLGAALRAAGSASGVGEVAVFDQDPAVAMSCRDRGGADRILPRVEAALDAHTVVLAVPVPAIVDFLRGHAAGARAGALIIDTGSAKRTVTEAMAASVPAGVHAVGGHPMAGTEVPGPAGADPARLRGAPFVLTPAREDGEALARGRAFALAVGARPVEMDAETHDRTVARTSHLPHAAAFALAAVAAAARRGGDPVEALIATGFAGATRLARSDPAMVAGFLRANAAEVAAAIEAARAELTRISDAVTERGGEALAEVLADIRSAAADLLAAGGER